MILIKLVFLGIMPLEVPACEPAIALSKILHSRSNKSMKYSNTSKIKNQEKKQKILKFFAQVDEKGQNLFLLLVHALLSFIMENCHVLS